MERDSSESCCAISSNAGSSNQLSNSSNCSLLKYVLPDASLTPASHLTSGSAQNSSESIEADGVSSCHNRMRTCAAARQVFSPSIPMDEKISARAQRI